MKLIDFLIIIIISLFLISCMVFVYVLIVDELNECTNDPLDYAKANPSKMHNMTHFIEFCYGVEMKEKIKKENKNFSS